MAYPKANPVAKHDILCPAPIADAIGNRHGAESSVEVVSDIESLASLMERSAMPPPPTTDPGRRLTTIYTYPDAPTRPKPLSRAPRICHLVDRDLFDRSTTAAIATTATTANASRARTPTPPLRRCVVAVKRPGGIPDGEGRSIENTRSFRDLVRYLRDRGRVALLACDSAGRIGFVVPAEDDDGGGGDGGAGSAAVGGGESHCAAHLYYAPMVEFIPWARANHLRADDDAVPPPSRRGHPQRRRRRRDEDDGGMEEEEEEEEEEPETWTPRYTPPPEEECAPRGWEMVEDEPATWTPRYTPPPEEECRPRGWGDDRDVFADSNRSTDEADDNGDGTSRLFVPAASSSTNEGGFGNDGGGDVGAGLWGWSGDNDANTASENLDNGGWDNSNGANGGWDTWSSADNVGGNWNSDSAAPPPPVAGAGGWGAADTSGAFHANSGAAAADAFYSNLTRSLDTRADSRLFHMRNFNGWVKATQIAELDPDTSSPRSAGGKKRSRVSPLRVLDLACGKGGDLGKWTIHPRKVENYVGVDVARGSLVDAALRARQVGRNKSSALRRCTFTLADLGEDVPGRRRSRAARRMQELQTWSLQNETSEERDRDPAFVAREGGGIAETDKFDVVSIQFAIHYMMSTRKRARRFFHTVSSLLEIGGNLIATTIDARVVVEKLMALGLDYHFDDFDVHPDVDTPESEGMHRNGNLRRKVRDGEGSTVSVGQGVCRLKFDADTLRRVFRPSKSPEDMFGLQYTFTLVEGSDHAAGVGEAVDLPEWLTPIKALEELAKESGLKLEYVSDPL